MPVPLLSSQCPLLLGSGSPRRAQILDGLGIPVRVSAAEVDETWIRSEEPDAYIERIVKDKARAARERAETSFPACPALLVADTIVTLDGLVLGKPNDREESMSMLARLSNRTHRVLTRHRIERRDGSALERTTVSEVTFRELSPALMRAYAETGEGLDKAGSYALQGKGALLVRGVRGSVTGVIGLPAAEVAEDLEELGLWVPFG